MDRLHVLVGERDLVGRRNFIAVFRDERLPTLLWAHGEAFRDHGGVCRRIAYDNQTAITLGRVGGRPRWHPSFLAFAQHYGFEPAVGRPRHKERRGKVERPFRYFEEDFLRARTFASWDDLRAQVREWLATVANVRVHGTIRRRVDEVRRQTWRQRSGADKAEFKRTRFLWLKNPENLAGRSGRGCRRCSASTARSSRPTC